MSMNAWHKINDHISVAQELEDCLNNIINNYYAAITGS